MISGPRGRGPLVLLDDYQFPGPGGAALGRFRSHFGSSVPATVLWYVAARWSRSCQDRCGPVVDEISGLRFVNCCTAKHTALLYQRLHGPNGISVIWASVEGFTAFWRHKLRGHKSLRNPLMKAWVTPGMEVQQSRFEHGTCTACPCPHSLTAPHGRTGPPHL